MKVNVPELNIPRIVIIGGGFGGITLAESLKNAPVQVVMFDKQNYHCFQPLLYQVATGGLEPDSIAFPIRKIFKRQKNFFFRMAAVEQVNAQKRVVSTSIGEIAYDYLVLATGSKTNFFGMENVAKRSHGMKNIPEALDLRSLILQNFEKAVLTTDLEARNALMNFVVVGAGPTGVETAGALAELKRHVLPRDYPELDLRRMSIHLVEAGAQVLPGMSAESSGNARKALEKLGVNLWLNTFVKGYDGETVATNSQKRLASQTVIWSAGVVGNSIPGLDEFEGQGGRLKVDEFNRLAGQDRIFAIGDVALMTAEAAYPKGHPMVAPVAIQQASLLGRNLKSLIYDRKMRAFVYRDKGSMATIGRNKAVVDVKKFHFKGLMAWGMWMAVHLFSLAGFRNRLVVFINWFWSYMTYDRGTRLIIRPFIRQEPEEKETSSEALSESILP
ncbi:MAG TPA: NAD(P)/FAD-dependent oxidoreductase [Bacteroidetes bacterium]|nr:NAD(P)/FAD-dependent oxidoreductase [Bacteroidota bacterium]